MKTTILNSLKTLTLTTVSVFSLAYASPSLASSDGALCGKISGQPMSMEEVKAKVSEQGYDVRRVKREDGCLEVYAIDKQGSKVEIYLHPVSGKIIKIKKKS